MLLSCQCVATGRWFSPGTRVSSTNKTDRHDITEILLKVTLNTINQAKLKLKVIVFQICSELPLHTFYATVYVIPAYFLAGLTVDVSVFFQVFGLLYLMIYCSRSLAMLSSAILPNFQLSCFFAQTFFSLFIMSAGFFINLDNIFSGKFGIWS